MRRPPTQIRHDYKTVLDAPAAPRRQRLPWLIIALFAVLGAGILLLASFGDAATRNYVAATVVQVPPVAEPELPAVTTDEVSAVGRNALALRLPPRHTARAKPAQPPATASALLSAPVADGDAQPDPAPQTPAERLAGDEAGDVRIQPPTSLVVPVATNAEDRRIRQALALPKPTARDDTRADAANEAGPARVELLVARGDTLDELFVRHGLSRADLARILRLDTARDHLQLLRPGDRIAISHDHGEVLEVDRVVDEERTLRIARNADGFAAQMVINPVERRTAFATGTIDSSLFRAAQRAGISDTLIMELAGVFAWDIDFVLDIRRGDRFTLLYEEIWQDGEKLRDGDILVAEFVNQGKDFRAVRFEDPDGEIGYFTPDGHNVKKAFLRAPIALTPRVTSNFNPRRLHPVHKKVRPHKGVDYGAPSGTPIKAAGDGKVIFRGRKGGYGNAVILQHGGNITTLYAHMSRFHKRARVGQRVRQGQVIGYVGASGTVTGAHLHYEYRVSGVHRNPRTVKLPQAEPVASRHRKAFATATAPLLARLELVDRSIRLARVSEDRD